MTPQPVWRWRAFLSRFAIALTIFTVGTASSVGYAYWYANDKISHHVHHAPIPDPLIPQVGPTQPANYLIVGSDSRAFVKDAVAADHFGTPKTNPENLADVIMIAHIDPNAPSKGFLVSIPRDTWVPIPGHGTQKINAAFNFGNGPALLIQTIEQNFKFTINHYLKLDFATFTDVVAAIGRVHIDFPYEAYDKKTGLYIPQTGCVALKPLQALAYARSRYFQYKAPGDGNDPSHWTKDPTSDIGRIQRQQYFIRSLAQEAMKAGGRNPIKAKRLLDNIVPHLVTDRHMGLNDFLRLVNAFRSVDPGGVKMVTVPTEPFDVNPTTSALRVRTELAQPIFALLGSYEKPNTPSKVSVKPAQVRVQVLNGSGVKGIASSTAAALHARGFANGGTSTDADRSDYQYTLVRYAPGAEAKAKLVLSYLHGAGLLDASSASLGGADVVIVTGQDFAGVVTPGSHPTAPAGPTTSTAATQPTTPGIPASVAGRPAVGCG